MLRSRRNRDIGLLRIRLLGLANVAQHGAKDVKARSKTRLSLFGSSRRGYRCGLDISFKVAFAAHSK